MIVDMSLSESRKYGKSVLMRIYKRVLEADDMTYSCPIRKGHKYLMAFTPQWVNVF